MDLAPEKPAVLARAAAEFACPVVARHLDFFDELLATGSHE
jgi:hypothetical protein